MEFRKMSKIYVGNLNYACESNDLETLFSTHGTVNSVRIIKDHDSGRSKGFAFVEMSSEDEAQRAITNLNDNDFQGRNLKVNKARAQQNRSSFDRNNRY